MTPEDPNPPNRERGQRVRPTGPVTRTVQTARLVMAVVWTLAIVAACLLPGRWINEAESEWRFEIPNLDKIIHAGIFAGFSMLWLRVGSSHRRHIWTALSGLALGALTELLQNLPIIGRDGDVMDWMLDAAGVVIGLAIARLVEPILRFFESRVFRDTTVPRASSADAADQIGSSTPSAR